MLHISQVAKIVSVNFKSVPNPEKRMVDRETGLEAGCQRTISMTTFHWYLTTFFRLKPIRSDWQPKPMESLRCKRQESCNWTVEDGGASCLQTSLLSTSSTHQTGKTIVFGLIIARRPEVPSANHSPAEISSQKVLSSCLRSWCVG